jgi:transcriptional regulator with XRE-family HTH domain
MYVKQSLEELIGRKIKHRRKALNMTQKDLAKLVGVSFQQIQKYENGQSGMGLSTFLMLCSYLNVSPDYFWDKFSFSEDLVNEICDDLEHELLKVFRSIQNQKIRKRIISLMKALVSDFD